MQIPGGYIQFPQIIYKALPEMTPAEALCTLVLIRETFGWHRATAFLRNKDFHEEIPIKSKTTIREALHAVEARGFFLRTPHRSLWRIGSIFEEGEEIRQALYDAYNLRGLIIPENDAAP